MKNNKEENVENVFVTSEGRQQLNQFIANCLKEFQSLHGVYPDFGFVTGDVSTIIKTAFREMSRVPVLESNTSKFFHTADTDFYLLYIPGRLKRDYLSPENGMAKMVIELTDAAQPIISMAFDYSVLWKK